jgi:urease accessory protein
MRLIHGPLPGGAAVGSVVVLKVDRLRLAKRRWRGFAEDGLEFGFDLEAPLRPGDPFFCSDSATYVIEQQPEVVVEMTQPDSPAIAARLGWLLGNLHFPLEIRGDVLRVCDDPAVRQMLAREGWPYRLVEAVFQPASGGHSHGV